MRVNAATREITCKVVYYGPGMSGKTTNLQIVHDRSPQGAVGEMVTLDTHSERTLHFDLLPMDVGTVRGFKVCFEFFTVPGQSYYAATRRLVLEGTDGVVFVADSRREALDENIDSMNDLLDNLRHHQLPEDIPVVIQYNKQDIPSALKPEQLDPLLNIRRWSRFSAVAINGDGVLETMRAISGLVLERVKQDPALANAPTGSTATQPAAAAAMPSNASGSATWLITCFRCLNMLEIPNARQGDLFTCGACGSMLQISDLEHGLTKPPPRPDGFGTQPIGEDSGYGMQALAQEPAAALRVPAAQPSGPNPVLPEVGAAAGSVPFEIEGFEQLAILDENVQGRRLRVRERATNQRLRALVLNPMLCRQPGYLAQVEPFTRMASQLRHPNLLPLWGLRQGRETPVVLSVDPPDHEALTHVLSRRRTLAPPHAIGIIRQMALALEEAARHGVVHGWLRPDVVMLSTDGNVLLDEIGVPKQHRYLVRELSGASAATEYYLAPEHLSDETRSDVRSDIFMLGALLFRMITGEGLVTGYNAHEALHKIAANGCRTIRSVQPNVSRDLDGFCQHLVASDRKDRVQTYTELVELCDKFGGGAKRPTLRLTGSSTNPAPGSTTRPASRPVMRGTAPVSRRAGTLAPGSGGHPRLGPSETSRPPVRRKNDSNAVTWVVVLLVVLALGAAALASDILKPVSPLDAFNSRRTNPPPTPNPTVTPKPTPAPTPTPTPTPVVTKPTPTPTPTPTPVVTKPTPTPTPVVTKPAPPIGPVGEGANTGDILFEISRLARTEHFAEALTACAKLTDAEARDQKTNDVTTMHLNRRKEVEAAVASATTLDQAQTAITPAMEIWGMPGDADWASDLLANSRARLPASPIGDPVEKPVVTPPIPTPTAGAPTAAAIDASWQIDLALAKSAPFQVDAQLAKVERDSAEYKAIKRKVDVWNERCDVLNGVLKERKPKLRITHPADHTLWDVVAAEATGLTVASTTGSSTLLEWGQVNVKDLARICYEAADVAEAKPRERTLAVVMQIIAGDPVLAAVQLKKGKASFDDATSRDLELLVAMRRQAETADLIKRGNDAAAASNGKQLQEVLDQLRRYASDPRVAVELSKLDELQRKLAGTTPNGAPGSAPGKDKLTFDAPEDLLVFAVREGSWQVKDGSLVASSDNANVVRKDVGNGKSVNIQFTNKSSRGAMTINFRGVRVLVEFSRNTVLVSTKDQELKPIEFPFIAKIAHSLYIEVHPQSGTASVELNGGVKILDVKAMSYVDVMGIQIDTGAEVAFDEIALARENRPIDPAAETARLEQFRTQGLEPIGAARFDAPRIVLPASQPHSGVGVILRDNITGVTFAVKGKGSVRVELGKLGRGDNPWIEVTLPDGKDDMTLIASWSAGMFRVADDSGRVINEGKYSGTPSHLVILAMQDATLSSTPKLNRQ